MARSASAFPKYVDFLPDAGASLTGETATLSHQVTHFGHMFVKDIDAQLSPME